MWLVICLILALFISLFNYSASKNNEAYDFYTSQKRCFDRHVNNDSLVFVKYIGDDTNEIKHNHYAVVTISTTDDNKITVELNDTIIVYNDYEQFKCEWVFDNED